MRDLAGRLTATQTGGELKLAGRATALELPHVFADPIALDSFAADVSWQRKGEQTIVRLERVDFANADAAGTAAGTWHSLAQGPGEIDLNAQLSRADARSVHRYLPRGASARARAWLARALVDGSATDMKLRLTGNLAQFPFADGKGGRFLLTGKAAAVTLDFAESWPALGAIDADFKVEGVRVAVDAVRGGIYGVQIERTHAEIPDVRSPHRVLRIDGVASGPTADFLRYVEASPVGGWINHATANAAAAGNGSLALKVDLPLALDAPARIDGEYTFSANQVRLAAMPTLDNVTGKLAFSEADVRARDIAAEALGGPVRLSLSASAGGAERLVHVSASGNASIAMVKRAFALPAAERMSGSADWTLALDLRDGGATWVVESPLKGAQIDLPAPLGKPSADSVALRVERKLDPRKPGEDMLAIVYGTIAQLAVHRRLSGEHVVVDRAQALVGRGAERAEPVRADRDGLWIRADVASLSIDDWLAFVRGRECADKRRFGRQRQHAVARGHRSRCRRPRCDGTATRRHEGRRPTGRRRLEARPARSRRQRHGDVVGARARCTERPRRRAARAARRAASGRRAGIERPTRRPRRTPRAGRRSTSSPSRSHRAAATRSAGSSSPRSRARASGASRSSR